MRSSLQVLGTPTAGRHGGDGDRQAAARLAGQHHLASPPDLASRHRRPDTDQEDSEAGLYTETGSLADNELDSEISSVWGPGPGEARLPGLALVSPLEYAAIMKQYTEPSLVLGQDITPDSGVVVDSRHHSKVRHIYSHLFYNYPNTLLYNLYLTVVQHHAICCRLMVFCAVD